MAGNKSQAPWFIKIWTALITMTCFGLAVFLFFAPNKERPDVLIISLFVIAVGTPLLFVNEFSEVNLFGFKFKLFEKVKEIEKTLLLNQVITTLDKQASQNWFWVDEFGDAYKINEETADFLSREKGIKKIDSFENLKVKGDLPSWKTTAEIKFHGPNIFVKYNGKLYYQSGLAWLYKLAALNSINFNNSDFREWKNNNGGKWAQELNPNEFTTNKVG